MGKRILLLEDEQDLAEVLITNLEMSDWKTVHVKDGNSAVRRFKEEHFDLVVLDIMVPGMDGLTVCENIRLKNSKVPILFLSAKGSAEDRITGLKKGGDDYVVKPFNLEEFLLKIDKLSSRYIERQENKVQIDEFSFNGHSLNFSSYKATGNQGEFTLTKKEALLLKLLIENQGEVVSRERILQTVWGYSVYPSTRTIDNFVLAFRKYFEDDPKKPKHFVSLRGVGYKFVV